MRMAIVHVSIHHQNTARVARAMADAMGIEPIQVADMANPSLDKYDLLGLGSGIFFGSHHRSLLRMATHWPTPPRMCFLFSTAGLPSLRWFWHYSLRTILNRQQIPILGEACYPGWDTVGPLRWIGGIQRGHPNPHDLEKAAQFAVRMLEAAKTVRHP